MDFTRQASDGAKAASGPWEIFEAVSVPHFTVARTLFEEYAKQLGVDLCFQDFASELENLPGMYGPPSGCLLLVMNDETAAGCGALRKLGDGVCEMKRLYVRGACRGGGLGRRIAERLVGRARALGYAAMRLDTLDDMVPALQLYASLGFRPIPAYYDNPLANSVYMELSLQGASDV